MTAKQECICEDNHGYSPTVPPEDAIGRRVGYGVFTRFLGNGGYNEEQSVLDEIATNNGEFQLNEHDPRQAEADSINNYLKAAHEISENDCPYCEKPHYDKPTFRTERNEKVARGLEIDAEITWEWLSVHDTSRDLISDEGYNAYLADV